jgi:hypothetical protein
MLLKIRGKFHGWEQKIELFLRYVPIFYSGGLIGRIFNCPSVTKSTHVNEKHGSFVGGEDETKMNSSYKSSFFDQQQLKMRIKFICGIILSFLLELIVHADPQDFFSTIPICLLARNS